MTKDVRVERDWRVLSIEESYITKMDEITVGIGGMDKAKVYVTRGTPESDMLYEAMRTRAVLRMTLEMKEARQ